MNYKLTIKVSHDGLLINNIKFNCPNSDVGDIINSILTEDLSTIDDKYKPLVCKVIIDKYNSFNKSDRENILTHIENLRNLPYEERFPYVNENLDVVKYIFHAACILGYEELVKHLRNNYKSELGRNLSYPFATAYIFDEAPTSINEVNDTLELAASCGNEISKLYTE